MNKIWVYIDQFKGQPLPTSWEGIGAGKMLAEKLGGGVTALVFGKDVEVEPVDVDRYGRTVALVAVFKRLVNEELVNAGFAWVYTHYCTQPICERWKALEQEAREAKRGLWADPHAIPPWEFRRKERSQ